MNSTLTIGLVQEAWQEDVDALKKKLESGIRQAALEGASLVCLQELTLAPYFCTTRKKNFTRWMEERETGPTATFISAMARKYRITITASLFEKPGFNTAIAMNPAGECIGFTRKQHIPWGEKYHEDCYFQPGDSNYPIHELAGHKAGLPTCYDQWFPELSRIYGLKGAELLIYPSAIGSEPTAPEWDTEPLWETVIRAQGIMANCFMVAINRTGTENGLIFYGNSFISNPFGEILAQAPRDEPATLVATLDFTQRTFFEKRFPFRAQRAPHTYHELVKGGSNGK